jgi:translation elongation factor EF-Tu-like GTPase
MTEPPAGPYGSPADPFGQPADAYGPPMDATGSQLWLTVADVFHIRGRGTVVTGQLQGNGFLNVGDFLVCEGVHWPVSAIEKFRAILQTAEPGADIGILLRDGPPGDVLRGQTVQFVAGAGRGGRGPAAGGPGPAASAKRRRWRR